MQGNYPDYLIDYCKNQGHEFLPGNKVLIRENGHTRKAEICSLYGPTGELCCGVYLDKDRESFLDVSKVLIIKKI
jgi:hypothetical protein